MAGCSTTSRLAKRDKVNLDIFWLKDRRLEESEDLPERDVLTQEIAEDLQAALEHGTGGRVGKAPEAWPGGLPRMAGVRRHEP